MAIALLNLLVNSPYTKDLTGAIFPGLGQVSRMIHPGFRDPVTWAIAYRSLGNRED